MVFVARIARRRATHPTRLRNGNAPGSRDVAAAAEDAAVGSMPRRTRLIFFGRVHARMPNAPSESGRVRARFERARRVARRRRATTPGWRFFPFCFSRLAFFFRGSSTPGPGETWIAVGTCGRPVAPARESAAATRETRRNTRPPAVTAALARAPRSRRPRRPPDRRVTRQQIPRTYLFSRSASGFFFFHERQALTSFQTPPSLVARAQAATRSKRRRPSGRSGRMNSSSKP